MSNYHSQEQNIYRNLSVKIQMGFYDDGERFPSVKEIADQFHVSYCPAQKALKMLEKDRLIRLCRGSATKVLKKPPRIDLSCTLLLQHSAFQKSCSYPLVKKICRRTACWTRSLPAI